MHFSMQFLYEQRRQYGFFRANWGEEFEILEILRRD